MSNTNYARMKATAERLLAKSGQAAILEQPGASTGVEYNPTPGVPVQYPSTVLEIDFTVEDKAGTLVQVNDLKFMLSTQGSPSPDLTGKLIVGGDALQVVSLKPKRPGGIILFWYVHCRK